jgi:predicted alpha/beta hydrolase family esterase
MLISLYLKTLHKINPRLGTKATVKLFSTPLSSGKRKESQLSKDTLGSATPFTLNYKGNKIACYQWGRSEQTVLLVHGWGGKAIDFAKLITQLVSQGLSVIAFDAPAHGFSEGKTTNVLEFRDIVLELIKKEKKISGIVAHSLGSVAACLALEKLGGSLRLNQLVLISTPTDLEELFKSFSHFLQLPDKLHSDSVIYIKTEIGLDLEKSSVKNMAKPGNVSKIHLFHDRDDKYVPVSNTETIRKAWSLSENDVFFTQKLGHYKILQNEELIARIQNIILAKELA